MLNGGDELLALREQARPRDRELPRLTHEQRHRRQNRKT